MDRLLELLKTNARTSIETLAKQLGAGADVEALLRDYECADFIRATRP